MNPQKGEKTNGYVAVRKSAHILIKRKENIMDIRIINGEGNVMNVSRMHISTNGQYLVALTEDMKSTITIERCKDEVEATQFLRWIKEAIKCAMEEESDNVLIDLESEDAEDGKRQGS